MCSCCINLIKSLAWIRRPLWNLKGTDMIMFAQCELFRLFGVRFTIVSEPFALTVLGETLTLNVRRNNYSHPFARLGVRLEQFDARTSNCKDMILIVRLEHSQTEPVSLNVRSSMNPAHDLQPIWEENRLEIVVFYLLYFDSEFKWTK